MSRYNILIVEDEPDFAEKINLILTLAKYHIIDEVESYELAIKSLNTTVPDLVILDIELIDFIDGGIRVARYLCDNFPNIPFIFLTSKDDPRLSGEAMKLSPSNFLKKQGANENQLPLAVQLILKEREDLKKLRIRIKNKKNLVVVTDQGEKKIKRKEIYFFAADGSYTDIHFGNGTKLTVTHSLNQVDQALKAANEFKRIHKSYIVNRKHVDLVKKGMGEIILEDINKPLPLGRKYKDEFLRVWG